MSVIAVVKRAARRKESLPGEIPSGGVYVLVFPRTSGMLVQAFQCPGTRELMFRGNDSKQALSSSAL